MEVVLREVKVALRMLGIQVGRMQWAALNRE